MLKHERTQLFDTCFPSATKKTLKVALVLLEYGKIDVDHRDQPLMVFMAMLMPYIKQKRVGRITECHFGTGLQIRVPQLYGRETNVDNSMGKYN